MRNKRFPNLPSDADYNTNAPSYYEDLARKEKLIRLLAERIWGYEKIVDETLEEIQERFRAWDKNLEDFPEDVKILLQQWLDNGTLDHIINDTIFKTKADQADLENVTAQLAQNKAEVRALKENVEGLRTGLGETFNTLTELQTAYPDGNEKDHVVAENGHRYYWDGEWKDGGLWNAVSIGDKTVTPESTTFIDLSSNIFPKHDIVAGYYVNQQTGEEVPSDTYSCTGFIKVTPNKTFTEKYLTALIRYNENKERISNLSLSPAVEVKTFGTVNASWVRFNFPTVQIDNVQINEGSELLPYEPPYMRLSPRIEVLSTSAPGVPGGGDTSEQHKTPYYFPPQDLIGYYEPSETFAYDDFNINTTPNEYYNKVGALVSIHSDYMVKNEKGMDASNTYPVNTYTLLPEKLNAYWINNTNKYPAKRLPKLMIVAGVHGEEKTSIFSLYYLMKDLCENWHTNPILDFIRHNVVLEIMPIANPHGFANNSQHNANGVNINRNFGYQFEVTEPGTQLYGGPYAFSEVESRIIRQWVDENSDALYFGDYHTNGTSGNNYNDLMWHPNHHGELHFQNLDIASQQLIELMTRKFIQRYDMPADKGYFGYINYSNPPRVSSYPATKGIPAHTFEVFRKLPNQTDHYNPEAIKAGTEYIGNWLGILLKQYKTIYTGS